MNRYFHLSSEWTEDGGNIKVVFQRSSFFAGSFPNKEKTVTPQEFKQMFGYAKRLPSKKRGKKGGSIYGVDMA